MQAKFLTTKINNLKQTETMETLFKRLSLENQKAILLKKDELPSTWIPIYGALIGGFSWSHLTIIQAMSIYFELCEGEFKLDVFWLLFEEEDES